MTQKDEALKMAIEALEYAKNGFWSSDADIAIQACKEALAELALERMAQNAKELGLDYCSHGSDSACKECYMEKAK